MVVMIVMGIMHAVMNGNGALRAVAIGMLPVFALNIILYLSGRSIRKRLHRFKLYISQLKGRSYCLIKDLSSVTGKSCKYTVKDLQKMMAAGMFPEGHFDDKKSFFMLNNECYEQYRMLQESMRMKAEQEQAGANAQNSNQSQNSRENQQTKNDTGKHVSDLKPEIRKALDEGRQYVREIRNANIAIPGEEVSSKLDRLELVTGRIFDYVGMHPEKYPAIKKFTEYFLPTTLKLLNAYKELDNQPIEGINISTTKKEIEDTLDTINVAFERLLDSLFEQTAMDISTDITVLETMLAQEGLAENGVKIKNSEGMNHE